MSQAHTRTHSDKQKKQTQNGNKTVGQENQQKKCRMTTEQLEREANQKFSATGTRTPVSCVRGKYAHHLHHGGRDEKQRRKLGT